MPLRVAEEEVIGKTPGEVFLDKKDLQKFIKRVKETALGKKASGEEYIAKRKDGTLFPISVNISIIGDSKGKPLYTIAVHRDITEKNKAEKEKEKFNEFAIGRELKMIQLKKEINSLLEKLGQKPEYNTDFK